MKKFIIVALITAIAPLIGQQNASSLCNGQSNLCNKRFNDITFPSTHNSTSLESAPGKGPSVASNQDLPVATQLAQGIRGFKINLNSSSDNSTIMACHGMTRDQVYEYSDNLFNLLPSQGFLKDIMTGIKNLFYPFYRDIILHALHEAYGSSAKPGPVVFNACVLDATAVTLISFFQEIKTFLDQHRNEVITIMLDDFGYKNPVAVNQAVEASGLGQYAYVQDKSKEWPTLGQMIESNKRAVLFLPVDAGVNAPLLNHNQDFIYSSNWNFTKTQDLLDDAAVPNSQLFQERAAGVQNKIFVVDHFIVPFIAGLKSFAQQVNANPILTDRIVRLYKAAGKKPNFIRVDFYEYGNLFDVVNKLNSNTLVP